MCEPSTISYSLCSLHLDPTRRLVPPVVISLTPFFVFVDFVLRWPWNTSNLVFPACSIHIDSNEYINLDNMKAEKVRSFLCLFTNWRFRHKRDPEAGRQGLPPSKTDTRRRGANTTGTQGGGTDSRHNKTKTKTRTRTKNQNQRTVPRHPRACGGPGKTS